MNTQQSRFERTLFGQVAGYIWMPSTVAWKEVNLSEREFRYSDGSRPTLRDMVLKATNDGDFQSCGLTRGSVRIRHYRAGRTVEKWVELSPESLTIEDCWASDEVADQVA